MNVILRVTLIAVASVSIVAQCVSCHDEHVVTSLPYLPLPSG